MTGQLSGRLFAFRLPSVMSLLGLSFLSAFSFSSFYPSSSSLLLASAQLGVLIPRPLVEQFRDAGAYIGKTDHLVVSKTTFGDAFPTTDNFGVLYYEADNSCHCTKDYCDSLKKHIPSRCSNKMGSGAYAAVAYPKIFVVVDRGICTFAEKSKVAKDHCGADAVIVLDTRNQNMIVYKFKTWL
eukprot:GHVS01068516.1.p1 GENE.GHVS01068516.1~~GHVS01068516.1.p1  ORF type:complete len:183 (+),score=8.48 GHVS01068516.1:248-796(+)